MDGFLHQLLLMLVVLAGVLALAWASLRLLRGRLAGGPAPGTGRGPADALRFVRALPVGPRERVVLLDHAGERWMLGVTAGGISLLARWPLGAEGSAASPPTPPPPPPAPHT